MTDKTAHTNFLGIPVQGDITQSGRSNVVQRPVEEFGPILQAVLDDPLFVAVQWKQYTPYFNDGDPCEFSVNTPVFLTTEDDPERFEDDPYDFELTSYGSGHPTLGKQEFDYVGDYPNVTAVPKPYQGNHEASHARAKALAEALEGGAFDEVLLDAFGDHAKVRVTRERIEVEFYDHD